MVRGRISAVLAALLVLAGCANTVQGLPEMLGKVNSSVLGNLRDIHPCDFIVDGQFDRFGGVTSQRIVSFGQCATTLKPADGVSITFQVGEFLSGEIPEHGEYVRYGPVEISRPLVKCSGRSYVKFSDEVYLRTGVDVDKGKVDENLCGEILDAGARAAVDRIVAGNLRRTDFGGSPVASLDVCALGVENYLSRISWINRSSSGIRYPTGRECKWGVDLNWISIHTALGKRGEVPGQLEKLSGRDTLVESSIPSAWLERCDVRLKIGPFRLPHDVAIDEYVIITTMASGCCPWRGLRCGSHNG